MSCYTREPEVSVFRKWPVSEDTPGANYPWAVLHNADLLNGRTTQDFKTHGDAVAFAHDLITEIARAQFKGDTQ